MLEFKSEQELIAEFNSNKGKLWLKSGNVYSAFLSNANADKDRKDEYPVTVVYTGVVTGRTWNTSLEEFMKKATPFKYRGDQFVDKRTEVEPKVDQVKAIMEENVLPLGCELNEEVSYKAFALIGKKVSKIERNLFWIGASLSITQMTILLTWVFK